MGLFTIEFELGRETRSMIERVAAEVCAAAERIAASTSVNVELGPQTRETLKTVAVGSEAAKESDAALGGIVAKARDEAKRVTGN